MLNIFWWIIFVQRRWNSWWMAFWQNGDEERKFVPEGYRRGKLKWEWHSVLLSDETTWWCLKSILLWNIRDVAWGDCSLVEKYVKIMSVHTDWRKVVKNGVHPVVSSINHPLGVPSVTFPRCDVVGTMVERLNLNLLCLNFAKYGPKAVLIGKIFRCIWTGGITSAVWSCRKLADCN